MKKLLLLLATFCAIYCHAQIKFEPGYFINNQNEKINCMIKNADWRFNPDQFSYKLSENDNEQTATIHDVREFVIGGYLKYERFTVLADTTTENLSKVSTNVEPEWKEKTTFLKVLEEGKINLYELTDGEKALYFVKTGQQSVPEQLIYKSYTRNQDGDVRKNNSFRSQLWNSLKDGDISKKQVETISYTKSSLQKVVRTYNGATGGATTYKAPGQPFFHLAVKPRVNSSSLDLKATYAPYRKHSFQSKTVVSAGIEGEFVLPFNQSKWTIPVELAFQSFKGTNISEGYEAFVDYKAIELPVGLRYYAFLADKMRLYLNAFVVLSKSNKADITFKGSDQVLPLAASPNFAAGAGLDAHNFSLEFRMYSERQILADQGNWDAPFKNYSLIIGYRIF